MTNVQCKHEVIRPRWKLPYRYTIPISYILFKSLPQKLWVEVSFKEHAQPGIRFKYKYILLGTKFIEQLSSNYWYALIDHQVQFGSGLIVGENEQYSEETNATVIGDISVKYWINYLKMSGSLCEVEREFRHSVPIKKCFVKLLNRQTVHQLNKNGGNRILFLGRKPNDVRETGSISVRTDDDFLCL